MDHQTFSGGHGPGGSPAAQGGEVRPGGSGEFAGGFSGDFPDNQHLMQNAGQLMTETLSI